jgi:hypothetical protein
MVAFSSAAFFSSSFVNSSRLVDENQLPGWSLG